jgi:alpha-amylase
MFVSLFRRMAHLRRSACLVALGALVVGACHAPPPGTAGGRKITSNVEDWRDEVIYQVLVDRFADGDLSNNYNVDRSGLRRGQYHGVVIGRG